MLIATQQAAATLGQASHAAAAAAHATCANSCGALINARAANEQLLCGDVGEINKL